MTEDSNSQAGDERLNLDELQRVLDAAVQLFSEGGLSPSYLEDISSRSGISTKRIYQHFGSARELVETLLERELQLIVGSVPAPELRFPGETLRDELEVLARIILDESRSHLGFLRSMLSESIRNPEFAAAFYRTFILRGRKLFTEFLTARRDRGELRPDIDVEAAAAFFLSALTFSLLLLEIFGGKSVEEVTDDRLIQAVSDLFLRGALADSGSSENHTSE